VIGVALATPAFLVAYVVLYVSIHDWGVFIGGEAALVSGGGPRAFAGQCLFSRFRSTLPGIALIARQVSQTVFNAFPEGSLRALRSLGITQRMIFDTVIISAIWTRAAARIAVPPLALSEYPHRHGDRLFHPGLWLLHLQVRQGIRPAEPRGPQPLGEHGPPRRQRFRGCSGRVDRHAEPRHFRNRMNLRLLVISLTLATGLLPALANGQTPESLASAPEGLRATLAPGTEVRAAAANSILTSLVVAIITYSLALVHAFGVLYFGVWTKRILQFTLSTLMCVSPMVLLLVIYAAKNDIGLLIVIFLAISIYPLTARLLLARISDAAADFHFLQAKILGHGPIGVFIGYAWPRFLPLTLPFFFLGFIYSLLMESMFSSLGLVSLPHGDTWGSLIHPGA